MQAELKKSMSAVTIATEWIFIDIVNYFAFLDFNKNLKIGLNAIGKMFIVSALLRNSHNILYNSTISKYFDVQPRTLQQYV